MILQHCLQRGAVLDPLAEENHDEHRRHHKVEAGGVKGDQPAEEGADQRPGDPIHLVEKGDGEVGLVLVDPVGNRRRVDDGEGLVAGGVDQVKLLRPHVPVGAEERDPVEQVARADHDRRREGRRRVKGRGENPHQEKLHRARVDDKRRHHRQPRRIARGAHQNPVGDAEEDVSGHHWERVPEDGTEGCCVSVLFFHDFVSAPLSYSFNIYVLYKKMWLSANLFDFQKEHARFAAGLSFISSKKLSLARQ